MAENLKSASITARDASPRQFVTEGQGGETRLKTVNDYATATTSAASTSTYRLVQVPADAKVKQVILDSDALSTSAAMDIGVYKTTDDGGAVVDADFFGSAVAVSSAVKGSDVTNESGNYGIDKRNMRLWEAVGLSAAPPSGFLDIVATATATVTTGGKIGALVHYA